MKSTGFPLLEYSQGSSMGLMSQPYYCSPRLSINNFISRESLMIGNQDISHSLIPQTISDYSHFAPPMSYAPQVIGNLQIIQSHNDCKCKCLCSCTQCSCSLNNSKALGCDSGLQPILPQKEETYTGRHVLPKKLPLPRRFTTEAPVFVNPKQYRRIIILREKKAKRGILALSRAIRKHKKYIHESRHEQAKRRIRNSNGRFSKQSSQQGSTTSNSILNDKYTAQCKVVQTSPVLGGRSLPPDFGDQVVVQNMKTPYETYP